MDGFSGLIVGSRSPSDAVAPLDTSSGGPRGTRGRRRGLVISLAGASGGVGATCLAAAVATRAAQRGEVVACVDVAATGGLGVVVDQAASARVHWDDLCGARGRVDGPALTAMLPRSRDGVALLTVGPPGDADASATATASPVPDAQVRAAVLDAIAECVDILVLDEGVVPRGGTAPVVRPDESILVVGCHVPAVGRAALVAAPWAARSGDRPWAAVRAPRGRGDIADAVADGLDLPLIAALYDDAGVDRALGRGEVPGGGRGPLAVAADRVLDAVRCQERA